MKKTTWLLLMAITAFFTLQVGAQNATSITETIALGTIPDVSTSTQLGSPAVITHTNGFAVTATFTDRTAFQAAAGTLTFEDFEGGAPPNGFLSCGGGVASSTQGSCFPVGELQDGILFTATGGDLVVVGTGSLGTLNPTIGSNVFADFTTIDFTNNDITAFGFDLYTFFTAADVEIRIIGTGGLIDSFSVTAGNPSFFGAVADEIITRVEIQDLTGTQAEHIGLLEFGQAVIGNPPMITCPMDIVLDASPSTCGAVVGFTAPLVSDVEDDPDPVAVQTAGLPSGSEFPVGVNTVTFTATDSDGNAVSCSFTITINDAEAPMAVCQDITVQLDASGQYVLDASEIDGGSTDNCMIASLAVGGGIPPVTGNGNAPLLIPFDGDTGSQAGPMDPSIATIADAGIIGVDYTLDNVMMNIEHTWADDLEVTLVAPSGTSLLLMDDDGGDAGLDVAATVTFNDTSVNDVNAWNNTAPEADYLPEGGLLNTVFGGEDINGDWTLNINDDAGGDSGVLNSFTISFAPAVMPMPSITLDCSNIGVNSLELTVTDEAGNTSTCTANVTVEDLIAPVITCEGGFMLNDIMTNGSFESGDFTGWTVQDIANPFIPYGVYSSIDGLGFFDAALPTEGALLAGNGFDGEGPGEIVLYQDVTIDAAATAATLSWDENIDYNLADFCGGCQDRIYEVQVRDMSDAVLEVLVQITATAGTLENDNVWVSQTADLSAYAGQDVRITYWQNIPEAFTGPAKFALDNVQLNVEILDSAPFSVELDANGMATIDVLDLVTVTDNCGTVTASVPGDLTCEDTSNPSNAFENGYFTNPENGFIVANDLVVAADTDFELFQITANLFHDVGATITNVDFTYYEDNAGEPGAVIGSEAGITPSSQVVVGNNFGFDVSETVFDLTPFTFASQVGIPTNYWISMSASSSASGIVAWEVSTASGTGDYDALNFDGTAWANPGPGSDGVYTFSGNCVPGADTTIDFTCADLGLNQIEVTVTDAGGNTATCTATVEVLDVTDPILICQDVTIEVGPDGTTMVNPEDLLAVMPSTFEAVTISSDNQSGAEGFTDFTVDVTADESVSFDWMYSTEDGPGFDSFGYLLNGVYTELTDPAGANNQSGNAAVSVVAGDVFGFRSQSADGLFGAATTVITNFMPGFDGQFEPANWTLNLDNSDGDAFFVEIPGGPLSFDACGITVLAVDVTEVTCADIGTPITATVFASDASGNIASCTSVITVVDALAPEVTCPADQTVDPGPGNLFYEVPDYLATGEATAVDNCTDPLTIVSQDPAPGTLIPDGVYTVTITAEDEYGNVGMCEFELTVESTLGLDDNVLDNAIALYPNPAQSQVTLANSASIALETAAIYDTNGRLINTIDLSDMQQEKLIDVSSLAAGVYMVQITSENASTVKRLVKE